jgi:LAO/AO transport system kinase
MTLLALREGGKRALAAALADLERNPDGDKAQALLDAAWREPKAHVVGVTGPPGVGKSSLCAALVAAWRKAGKTVGVIAVDPVVQGERRRVCSGDRVRIVTTATDEGVFVRSMAARDPAGRTRRPDAGRHGGDARPVRSRADRDRWASASRRPTWRRQPIPVVFCVQPGSGDSLQFMKAGYRRDPAPDRRHQGRSRAGGRTGARRRGGCLSLACGRRWP